MEKNINVFDVASFFLNKDSEMTHKKLQKLVYYSYVWYLVKNNDSTNIQIKLFDDDFEAWIHGPVCRTLYNYYPVIKGYPLYNFEPNIKNFLERIWSIYGEYTGAELEDLTHSEAPWKKARGGLNILERSRNVINDIDIYNYYSNIINRI